MSQVADAACVMVGEIGHAVSDPQLVDMCLGLEDRSDAHAVRDRVTDIVRSELERLPELRDAFLREQVTVY